MNSLEHFFCASSFWRLLTQRQLLPWILADGDLGDHVLELGAGYGAATSHLLDRTARVTSLDHDANAVLKLKRHHNGGASTALRGDAAQLPFANSSFSSVIAILVLHHLPKREAQDRMFAEVFRVLRPGGIFFAFEIHDNWMNRFTHFKCTFTPLRPGSAFARLTAVGFSRISMDFRSGGYRLNATRSTEEEEVLSLHRESSLARAAAAEHAVR
jgi:SAM-dependent methyltransferase